jgi:hypothetical protein
MASKKTWVLVLSIVAAILGMIAFLVSYAEGDPEWVPLVIAVAMIGMAISWMRKPS